MNATGFWGKTRGLVAKDVRVEARGRETLPPMLAFALAVALLLAFSLPPTTELSAPVELPFGTVTSADVIAGFLWITVLFAGLIGFARTFEVEREDGALDVMLLIPLDRSGLYASKAIVNLAYVVAVEAFLFPVFALLFGLDLGARWWTLLTIAALTDVGFVCLGTLFAAIAAHTRSRELMLPLLALPALVPAFIAAVELTSDVLAGGGMGMVAARGWFGLMVAFDLIFAIVGTLAFEFVLD